MKQLPSLFLLSIVVTTTLAGCATPAEMRKQSPELELKSSLPAKTVSTCIADHWENLSLVGQTIPINMRPIENGYTVYWRNESSGHTMVLVDVTDIAEGSLTRYFTNSILRGACDKVVIDCQDPTKKTTGGSGTL